MPLLAYHPMDRISLFVAQHHARLNEKSAQFGKEIRLLSARGESGRAEILHNRVIRVHGGHYYVQTDESVIDCTIRGRLKKVQRGSDIVAVGDRVRWTLLREGHGVIEEVLPRETVLSRRLPPPYPGAKSEHEQVILANPDQVLLVFAVRNPPLNTFMLDRYLVACEAANLDLTIVINKCDLPKDSELNEQLSLYQEIGYDILYTSAETGRGIDALKRLLKGKLSVLTGPSGVGKSSLLNAIWPHLSLQTGDISTYHDRGKHTTVVTELLYPEPGYYVADTPGLRVFLFWDIDPEQLEAFFPEMLPYLRECRFTPCTHTHEPQCAVQKAVEEGDIHPSRYESYLKMFHADY